jgi:hypothetical protein
MVGGFKGQEAGLYANGIQHILNTHGKVGAFTIHQVIADEGAREDVRDAEAREIKDLADRRRMIAANKHLVATHTSSDADSTHD